MNILCPIDFSNHSLYALDYAIQLGNALGAKLHLFTAYSVPKSTGRLRSLDNEIKKAVLEDLSEVLMSVENKITSGIKAGHSVMEGNSGRVISEFSRTHDIDLIIMGTQGKGSLSNIFMGSVAKKVVDNALVPVIAIPFPIKEGLDNKKLIINLDEKEIKNDFSLRFLRTFVEKLNLRLEVFHVENENIQNDFIKNSIEKLTPHVAEVVTISSQNITESIKKNAENSNGGLIVMIRRPHSFWSRLFMDTNTSTELAMTRIPIMILPE